MLASTHESNGEQKKLKLIALVKKSESNYENHSITVCQEMRGTFKRIYKNKPIRLGLNLYEYRQNESHFRSVTSLVSKKNMFSHA